LTSIQPHVEALINAVTVYLVLPNTSVLFVLVRQGVPGGVDKLTEGVRVVELDVELVDEPESPPPPQAANKRAVITAVADFTLKPFK